MKALRAFLLAVLAVLAGGSVATADESNGHVIIADHVGTEDLCGPIWWPHWCGDGGWHGGDHGGWHGGRGGGHGGRH